VAPQSINAGMVDVVGYLGILTGKRNKSGVSEIEVSWACLKTPTSLGVETASLME